MKALRIAILTTDTRESVPGCTDPQPRLGIAPGALLQGFARLPEVEVHVLSCLKAPLPSPQKIADNVFYHGIVVPRLGWMRTGYQGCIRAVKKKLEQIGPDVVHGQGTERDCAISAAWSGFPNVVTVHGNMRAIAKSYRARIASYYWLAARLESATLKKTDGVFCNSAYTESQVAARAKKMWRVANALREEFFQPRPLKSPGARPVFLNAGMILPYKQQVELLGVARRLHALGFKFEFQFAGANVPDTEYGAAFTRELALAEKAGYARYLGLLTTPQLIAAMDAADALVHFPTEEAFGLVVAEALARNLKLFASNTGGIVDIVEGVAAAELFPASDFAGLETALARWLTDRCPPPADAAELMRARYHPKIIAQRHLEIYREVPGR